MPKSLKKSKRHLVSNLKNLLKTQKPMLAERDEQGHVPQQMLGSRIPKELHHRLKLYAATHDRTMAEVITEAIEDYLDAQK